MGEALAEAKREAGNIPHVKDPKPPTRIYGVSLEKLEQEATQWAEQATDEIGRKLRKDGHCLLAGVVSVGKQDEDQWESVKKDSVKWLKSKYGERLRCVIEHTDEKHKHIHFYCVAKAGESFEVLHDGQRVAKKLKKEGELKGVQNLAYIEEMRRFQDAFSEDVGIKNGLVRIGPRGRRLTKAQWHQETQQGQALKLANEKAKRLLARAEEKAREQAQKIIEEAEQRARQVTNSGASVGAFFGAVVGGFKASKHEQEIEALQAVHSKQIEALKKTHGEQIEQSESARNELKKENKNSRELLKKHSDYIQKKEREEREQEDKKVKEEAARQRAREREEQTAQQQKNKGLRL